MEGKINQPAIRSVSVLRIAFIAIIAIAASIGSCTSRPKAEPQHLKNVLHLITVGRIKTLDPAFSEDASSNDEVGRVYETLLQYHYLKRPYVLVPGLAESLPEISSDRKTYIFRIKKGILFQDDSCFKSTQGKGREMISDDVVYSFKRLADPFLKASGWWIFDHKIQGLNEWREDATKSGTADYKKEVSGLKVIDRYTVQITLVKPNSQFLYLISMTHASIVPHEAAEQYGSKFSVHPVGTGPFRLAEFNPASKLTWEKNPTYRNEIYPSEGESDDDSNGLLSDSGKKIPFVDRINVKVVDDLQNHWNDFINGKIDVIEIPKDQFPSVITTAKELNPELKKKGIGLFKFQRMDITHISFNMSDPLLGKNKFLRQALSLAYDDDSYIDIFWNGRGIPAQGPIPPGVSGYNPKFRNVYRQFNLAKAKEYLAKAGYPDGRGLSELEMVGRDDNATRQLFEYTQKMFSSIGVKLKLTTYNSSAIFEAMKTGKAQLWHWAWVADYPDGESFLQLFYSKNWPEGPNDSGYSNVDFDRLYEAALALPDGEQRDSLFEQMVKIVAEDCPWIFNIHRNGYYIYQPWLKDFKYGEVNHSGAKYYRVDLSLKNP